MLDNELKVRNILFFNNKNAIFLIKKIKMLVECGLIAFSL